MERDPGERSDHGHIDAEDRRQAALRLDIRLLHADRRRASRHDDGGQPRLRHLGRMVGCKQSQVGLHEVQERAGRLLPRQPPADILRLHGLLHERGPAGEKHHPTHMGLPEMVHHILRRGLPAGQAQRLVPGVPLHPIARHMGQRQEQIRLRGTRLMAVVPGAGQLRG